MAVATVTLRNFVLGVFNFSWNEDCDNALAHSFDFDWLTTVWASGYGREFGLFVNFFWRRPADAFVAFRSAGRLGVFGFCFKFGELWKAFCYDCHEVFDLLT